MVLLDCIREECQRRLKNFDASFITSNVSLRKVGDLSDVTDARDRSIVVEPTGVLTFRRSVLEQQNLPQWKQSNERLTKLHVSSAKKIEEFGGVLQVESITFVSSVHPPILFQL